MTVILNNNNHFSEDILTQLTEDSNSVVFQHTDKDLLKSDLKQLIEWENEKFRNLPEDSKELFLTLNVQFKSLSLDLKIEVFKHILLTSELVNSNLLLNLLMLISSNTKYQEDEVYKNSSVIFGQLDTDNGLEEFLDIKIAIKEEVNFFLKELMKYYLSCLCSTHFKESDIAYDSLQIMPVKYHQMLSFLTFDDLSRLSRRVIGDMKDLELVSIYNAKSILNSLVLNQYPVVNFLDSFKNLIKASNE